MNKRPIDNVLQCVNLLIVDLLGVDLLIVELLGVVCSFSCMSDLLQMVYGGHIYDTYDQQALNAIVDYWVSPVAVKKDFELAKR